MIEQLKNFKCFILKHWGFGFLNEKYNRKLQSQMELNTIPRGRSIAILFRKQKRQFIFRLNHSALKCVNGRQVVSEDNWHCSHCTKCNTNDSLN